MAKENSGWVDMKMVLTAKAEFYQIIGMVCDPAGNLYACDFLAGQIRKITPAGTVTTLAGSTDDGPLFLDGPALKARFFTPVGLAMDKHGNIYVGDENNLRVRKIIVL